MPEQEAENCKPEKREVLKGGQNEGLLEQVWN